jgi:hypothetical protein
MSRINRLAPVFVVLSMALSSWAQTPAQTVGANSGQISTRSQNLSVPLAFEPNRGQAVEGVDFVARGQGYSAQLRADSLTLVLNRASDSVSDESVVEICLAGANRNAKATADDKLAGRSNYLLGSDPANWITNVGHYAKVRYGNVYPGIDLVFHGNQSRLEHDFVIRPAACPDQIGLSFSGVRRTELSPDGDLVLQTKSGEMRLQRPQAYQNIGGSEVEVPVKYVLREGHVGFSVGRYDRSRDLTIDPVLVYSTYFGGAAGPDGSHQAVNAVALDSSGNLYVAGSTDSTTFPVTTGVVDSTPASAFISKLDPTGTSLIYSTYMQGLGISGLAVDALGDVFVVGQGKAG